MGLGHRHEWASLWSRQEARLPLAREWWAWTGGREGSRVADVGCGPGFLALQFASWAGPAGRVLALDVSEEALAFLSARVGAQIEARRFDAEAERLVGDFDIVIVANVLHHAEDPLAILRNVHAPGRTILVAEYDPEGPGESGPPAEDRIAPARMATLLREAGWSPEAPRAQAMEEYAIVAKARREPA